MAEQRLGEASFADLAHLTELADSGAGGTPHPLQAPRRGEERAWAPPPETYLYPVRQWADVAIARHQARRMAREHGLAPRRAGEVAIVVSELASNIVKYGVRGEVAVAIDTRPAAAAMVVVTARDAGPPFRDLATALRDGHDDRSPIDPAVLVQRGGLGTGLGAVLRLTDRLEVRQEPTGKEITATFSRQRLRPA
jgi:anti-sigma regulatory factor (Ser/Thr protein kinase)